jgi:hypothetical protein
VYRLKVSFLEKVMNDCVTIKFSKLREPEASVISYKALNKPHPASSPDLYRLHLLVKIPRSS